MSKRKIVSIDEALAYVHSGCCVMIPGFTGTGVPDTLLRHIYDRGITDLDVISNNAGTPGVGIGELIRGGRIKKLHASHIGRNREAVELLVAGKMDVELIPMGTLAERIRAGGTGLGGVLVKTGLGTLAEEGKQRVTVNGETWLLETPLRAQVALIHAWKADSLGNLQFRHTAKNYNGLMCAAADVVLVEAELIVPVGDIQPDDVDVPGCMVTCVIQRDAAYINI